MTEQTTQNKNQDFISVPIDSISNDTVIDFNLYTYENNRHFLFCGKNAAVKKENLPATYLKKTRYFFIKKEDRPNYRSYVEIQLPSILSNQEIPKESKVEMVYDVSHAMVEQAFTNIEEVSTKRITSFTSNIVNFIFKENVYLKEIVKFSGHDFYTYDHSLHVMIYSSMFYNFLGDVSAANLQKLALAGFLHDIGKSQVPSQIITKPGKLDNEEWNKMKMHPKYGVDIIQKKLKIKDPLIESLTLNHHERIDGMGYPNGKQYLTQYEKIIGIIDTYDAITSTRSYQNRREPFDALAFMIQKLHSKLDVELMRKFALMLGQR